MEYDIISPFTGESIGRAPETAASDVAEIVARAAAAAPAWRKRPWAERAAMLADVGAALAADEDAMAELLAQETGITIAEGRFTVMRSADEFAYWGTVTEESLAAQYPDEKFGPHTISLDEMRRPLGVVAAILPYNASIMGAAAKLGPALLVGNTVVTKAPPQNPLALQRLFEMVRTAGIDVDVAPLLTGQAVDLGAALVADPRVHMISFTGSTTVGLAIQREAAKRLTRTALELGGKGALIVAADADIDAAVAALAGVWTRQAGQICSIPSRGIVHSAVYEEVRGRLRQMVSELPYAEHWTAPAGPRVGPVISTAHARRVEDLIARSDDPQATQITRGAPAPSDFHVSPALIETTDTRTPAFREEAFGPVLTLVAAQDDEDAVRLANDSEYGLVNYVFTSSRTRARKIAAELQSGAVVVNGFGRHSLASSGGVKSSGIAREGRIASLDIYTERQSVSSTI